MTDLAIRGALVVDGTGSAPRVADVGVTGSRITFVGEGLAPARVEVDGSDLVLAPGFIDVHTHDDLTVFDAPLAETRVAQGVTAVIAGNCGTGPAPRAAALGNWLYAGARVDTWPEWTDTASWLDAVDALAPGIHVATLAGHGVLRAAVLGDEPRHATSSEIAAMRALLAEALDGGALGLSTGLVYTPGRAAAESEILALCEEVALADAIYTSHMRDEGDGLIASVVETLRVGEETGARVEVSHLKATGRRAWGLVDDALELIDSAHRGGVAVHCDAYPYDAGMTGLLPIVESGNIGVRYDADDITLIAPRGHPEWDGRTLASLAGEMGLAPLAAAQRVLESTGGSCFTIGRVMHERDVRTVLAHPGTIVASDSAGRTSGSTHPRTAGTFARVLGRYVRDESRISLTDAIRRMTHLPATHFQLRDRGVIAVGAHADLVLFDPATITDKATFSDPLALAVGVSKTWEDGELVWNDGTHTGARPGGSLRRVPHR